MFCPKCANQLPPGVAFCTQCGTKLLDDLNTDVNQDSPEQIINQSSAKRNKNWWENRVVILAVIVFAAIILVMFSSRNSTKYIEMVKYGYPFDYPNRTYGEAFEEFFSNPKWEYFKSEDDEDIVEFTGGCTYYDSEVTVTLQFIIDEDAGTFDAGYFDMNGVPQNQLFTAALIEKVFDD